MDDKCSKPNIARIDLTGYKHSTWRVKTKIPFLKLLKKLWGTPVNPETKETVGDEASKLASKGLLALESQLDKQSVENQLKQAQIEKTFEEKETLRLEREKTKAEVRKLNAETAAQEIANAQNALRCYKEYQQFAEEFERKTGKKLRVKVAGPSGEEMIFVPPEITSHLSQQLEEFTAPPRTDNVSGNVPDVNE